MNASYIKCMNTTTHNWMKHEKGTPFNITILDLGEGYEVGFEKESRYTFTGLPGAMIIYDDVPFGFDATPITGNVDSLTAEVNPSNGNVNLTWTQASGIDTYYVYNSTTRDGFFRSLGVYHHLLATTPLGSEFCTHPGGALAGTEQYYMVIPFISATGERGVSCYSMGVWTEEFLAGYDTLGIPLIPESNQSVDWYCDNITEIVGMNHYDPVEQRWIWHSCRMPEGAFDVILEMGLGYQISTSNTTKYTFIGT
jgi:hypothetical protein